MKDAANNTKQALDVSEKAIEKANAALKEAHSNLNSTRNATAEVQDACKLAVCWCVITYLCNVFQHEVNILHSPISPQLPP